MKEHPSGTPAPSWKISARTPTAISGPWSCPTSVYATAGAENGSAPGSSASRIPMATAEATITGPKEMLSGLSQPISPAAAKHRQTTNCSRSAPLTAAPHIDCPHLLKCRTGFKHPSGTFFCTGKLSKPYFSVIRRDSFSLFISLHMKRFGIVRMKIIKGAVRLTFPLRPSPPEERSLFMDYWGIILQKYLSYSAIRYILTGFATLLFILLMLILGCVSKII